MTSLFPQLAFLFVFVFSQTFLLPATLQVRNRSVGLQQEAPAEEGPPRQSEVKRAQAIQTAESGHYMVRQVAFLGNFNTRDQVTRRKLAMNEGDEFHQKDVEESLRRINRLGIFLPVKPSDVDYWLDHENKEVDMLVRLVEKKSVPEIKKSPEKTNHE